MYIKGAKLIFQQSAGSSSTGITKTESHYQLLPGPGTYGNGSYAQTYQYNQFDPSSYTTSPTCIHEATY